MATWVRQNSASMDVSSDAEHTGSSALDNATAPGDFDPAGVTQVVLEVTVTGSGFDDDTWGMDTADGARLNNGATVLASSGYGSAVDGLQNSSNAATATDGSPDTGQSEATWEGATVSAVTGLLFTHYDKVKGADASTRAIAAADVTVTITYTPAAPVKVPQQTVISREPSRTRLLRESGRMG